MKSKGIVPQAYSPLGSTNSPLLTDEVVTTLADKYSLKPADILLGYLREYQFGRTGLRSSAFGIPRSSCEGNCSSSQVSHSCAHQRQL